eukprot:TRINITY_DN63102_c0_g1_i1.p1 TRINITY_DN63102_c0_g1~~TRINITY_DN63102_c0_g1_i1.p1  ORF type:complete len:245 (-),score=34.78 TRINITY_DN63102_c0_g1_i1:135-869(-)
MKPCRGFGCLLRRAAAVVGGRTRLADHRWDALSSTSELLQAAPKLFLAPAGALRHVVGDRQPSGALDGAASLAIIGGDRSVVSKKTSKRWIIAASSTPSLLRSPAAAGLPPPSFVLRNNSVGFGACRAYNVVKAIPWRRVRSRIVAFDRKQRKSKAKNHADTLTRFRLTRFGWERRKAGLRAMAKRRKSWASKKRARTIEYVHRSDINKLIRTVPYMRLKIRDPAINQNVNLRPSRQLVPAHFG